MPTAHCSHLVRSTSDLRSRVEMYCSAVSFHCTATSGWSATMQRAEPVAMRRGALVRRCVGALPVGAMASNGTSQCILLGGHPSRRRYTGNVVAPILRRSCGVLALSYGTRRCTLCRVTGDGLARLVRVTWSRRRWRRGVLWSRLAPCVATEGRSCSFVSFGCDCAVPLLHRRYGF